jgi:glycosyltransferase involved in cell wall biosynthesis
MSRERPLVSVVIPCFNQAHFLGDAIASALAQTYAPVEVIVVDDGSTDDTAAVAARFPGVRYVHRENGGLSAARNTGFRESRGAYLAFLDADDVLLPRAVETALQCLEPSPECAFVSGRFRYVDADGALTVVDVPPNVPADPYLAFLRGNHIGMHATVVYRRAPLEAAHGFDVSLAACEDYDLFLRLAAEHPVLRHDEVVADYRQHGANMSRDLTLMLPTVLAVLRRQWPRARRSAEYRRGYRTGRRTWQMHYGPMAWEEAVSRWRSGQRGAALRLAALLVRHAPRYLLDVTIEALAAAKKRLSRSIGRRLLRVR